MADTPTVKISFPATIALEGAGGVSDHGELTGLGDDDHPQYLNQARGDARYVQPATAVTLTGLDVTNLRISLGNGQWVKLVPVFEDGKIVLSPVVQ